MALSSFGRLTLCCNYKNTYEMLEANLSHKFHRVYFYRTAMQFLPIGKKKEQLFYKCKPRRLIGPMVSKYAKPHILKLVSVYIIIHSAPLDWCRLSQVQSFEGVCCSNFCSMSADKQGTYAEDTVVPVALQPRR